MEQHSCRVIWCSSYVRLRDKKRLVLFVFLLFQVISCGHIESVYKLCGNRREWGIPSDNCGAIRLLMASFLTRVKVTARRGHQKRGARCLMPISSSGSNKAPIFSGFLWTIWKSRGRLPRTGGPFCVRWAINLNPFSRAISHHPRPAAAASMNERNHQRKMDSDGGIYNPCQLSN